jgi:hypothetical protein
MLTMPEHTPKVRFPRLTTHFGPITPLFCVGLAFRCGQNFAVSGLYALSCHPARQVARAGQHDGRFPTALSPQGLVYTRLPAVMAQMSHRSPGGVHHAPAPTRRCFRPRQNGRRGRCARRLPGGTFYMYGAVSVTPRALGKAVEHGTEQRTQQGTPG